MSNKVRVSSGIEKKYGGGYNTNGFPNTTQWFINNSAGAFVAGDVVILDTSVTYPAVTTTTTGDDELVAGVVVAPADQYAQVEVLQEGWTSDLKVDGTTDIAVGDVLSTFTTAKIAQKRGAGLGGGFAVAYEAYTTNDSAGVIDAYVRVGGFADDTSVTATVGLVGEMAADGVGAANAVGATTTKYAPISHVHTLTADTPALTLGTTNSAGTAGLLLQSDATVALFDATAVTTIAPDATAATGSAAYAARRDHTHGAPAAAPADGSLAGSNAEGDSTSFSRANHNHKAILLDDVDFIFGTDSDIIMGHSSANTSAATDDLVLGLGNTNRALHVGEKADAGSDWAVAADTHPSLYWHSATTPTTDYLKMWHDATDGYLRSVGGTLTLDAPTSSTINFAINGTKEIKIDASALSPVTNDGEALGTTALGWEDLHLATGGVINWANGEVTITETANALALAGAYTWTLEDANSTNNTGLIVSNTSNAAAASHSYIEAKVGGTTSTGDPQVRLTIPSGTSWYIGADNNSSDKLVLGVGTAVGTTPSLTFDQSSSVASLSQAHFNQAGTTLTDGASAYAMSVHIPGRVTTFAGTTQVTTAYNVGLLVDAHTLTQSGGAVTVNEASGIIALSPKTTTSVTLTAGSAFRVQDSGAHTGTGSNQYGLYVEALTSSTKNYAFWNNGAAANVVLQGSGALATTATNGFTYLPTCAGAPSGTPTAVTGAVPLIFDTTNNKIYIYDTAWLSTAALT